MSVKVSKSIYHCYGGYFAPCIDPETYTEAFRKNLLHLSHSLGNACHAITLAYICPVNAHVHTGSPLGCAAYGSV